MLWYTVTLFYSHNYHNRFYKNCSLERSRCSTQLRCPTYIIIIFTLFPPKGMLPLSEPEAAYRLVRRTPVVPIACKTSPPRTEEVHVLFTCRKRLVKITYWICGDFFFLICVENHTAKAFTINSFRKCHVSVTFNLHSDWPNRFRVLSE